MGSTLRMSGGGLCLELPAHRPDAAVKPDPKEAQPEHGREYPVPVGNWARAAFRATGYVEGGNTFIANAIEAETARREAEHNAGEMYPSWAENLPGGRRLKDS